MYNEGIQTMLDYLCLEKKKEMFQQEKYHKTHQFENMTHKPDCIIYVQDAF